MPFRLSKSDFKIARTCPTKLYYKKLRYPSLHDDDPYLEFLADGGYMVETMAKLLYPGGVEVGDWSKPEKAFAETERRLQNDGAVLFEPTIVHDGLLARIDILRRRGRTLELIEVKSSGIDSVEDGPAPFRGTRGGITSSWRPYLEDVTFQAIVLGRAFPGFSIAPYLCVVDKAKAATPNTTFDQFRLTRREDSSGRTQAEIAYLGNPEKLREAHILAVIDVSSEVAELRREVEKAAEQFAQSLRGDSVTKIAPEIGQHCKHCEYRLSAVDARQNGFRECWGSLADPNPHVLDLCRIGLAGGGNRDVPAEMAANGTASLLDVPDDALTGAAAERQRIEIRCTAENREHLSEELPGLLANHPHPLHFIDFEASRLAIPYHPGMRPYELAAFQWSCHTLPGPRSNLKHAEWLNIDEAFPNFEFARTLRDCIGDEGTVYIWSHYEITVLKEIRRQMNRYRENDSDLADWLDRLTEENNPRIVDLCRLAADHYFHPAMAGSVSIKYVLPAVWQTNPSLRSLPEFAQYVGHGPNGELLNPYDTLPPLTIGDKSGVVSEGTGAIRIYQELIFGSADPSDRENYRQLLLQYCRLDTAAMVMIWRHWTS